MGSGFLRPFSLLPEQWPWSWDLPARAGAAPRTPAQHSLFFLAPEVVDGKGDCNEDQEHSHGNQALHPGLQVPQAWKGRSGGRVLQRAGHSGAASAGGASCPPGLLRGYQPAAGTSGELLGNEDPSDP